MGALRRDGGTARQHAGNDHQADRAASLRVRGQRRRAAGVLRAGSDDDRHAGRDQLLHAGHPLFVVEQRPVAHRAAVDDGGHAEADELLALSHQRVEVRLARRRARRHERGDHAGEGVLCHARLSRWATDASRYRRHDLTGGASRLGGKPSPSFGFRKCGAHAPIEQPVAALGRPLVGDELFDAIPDTIFFVKDAAGRYVAANQVLAERTGFPDKEALIGLTADEVFPGELGRRIAEQDRAMLRSARSLKGELELHLYPGRRGGLVPDLEGAAV